ncbi:hypothetical protein, partial [Acinetobacter baumannii]|uniref:hypothetical protein n=1 Tax=Acinetobacter baumannii TaxID=470 RepID=UPI003330CFFE
ACIACDQADGDISSGSPARPAARQRGARNAAVSRWSRGEMGRGRRGFMVYSLSIGTRVASIDL